MPRPRSNAVSGPSTAPALSSQRPRSPMIGAHRQQQEPVLDMQQTAGNQAAAEYMYDIPNINLSAAAGAVGASAAEAAAPAARPSSGYGVYSSIPAAPAKVPAAEEPSSGYGVYSSIPAAPTPESTVKNDGYTAYTAYTPRFNPENSPQAASDGYIDVEGAEEEEQEEAQASQVNNMGFAMKSMGDGMEDFDKSLLGRANPHMGTSLPSTTFYADTPEKRAPYTRQFDSQGKMSSASDGSKLDTIGAERPAAIGAKGDRHIFAMDGEGQFHTTDAIKENKQRGQAAAASGASQQERFHHSSFLAGQDVAGAGEMQVRDGQVELVSDTSGHYQPGSKQMMQTVQQLEKNNVATEKLGVEFVGKGIYDESGNKTGQTKNMQASATELLGYQNHSPETAETQMRAMHDKKNSFLGELLGKAQNNPEGRNLKPSELNRRPEEAAPGPVVEQESVEAEDADIRYNNVEDFHNLAGEEEEGPEVEAEEAPEEEARDNYNYN